MQKFDFTAIVSTPIGARGTIHFTGIILNQQYVLTVGNRRLVTKSKKELMKLLAEEMHVNFLEYTAPESCIMNVREIPAKL
jgi:hypothetical protein